MPEVMFSACRMVAPLVSRPARTADSGRCAASGSSRPTLPSCTSCRTTVAVMVLVMLPIRKRCPAVIDSPVPTSATPSAISKRPRLGNSTTTTRPGTCIASCCSVSIGSSIDSRDGTPEVIGCLRCALRPLDLPACAQSPLPAGSLQCHNRGRHGVVSVPGSSARSEGIRMKVLIAGGTGALGIPIVEQLIEAGHSVTGLTRTRLGAEHLQQLGARAVIADAMERDALLRAIDGHEADAVVHQMTALKKAPVGKRDLDATNRLRVAGTSHLVDAARVVGARRFVTQSIVFGYGYRDHGDTVLTEESPFGMTDGRLFDPAVAAMASTEQQAFEADGIEGIA